MIRGGSVGIERARGEFRYRCHHRAFSITIDLTHASTFDDGRVRISVRFSAPRWTIRVTARDPIDVEAFALYFDEPTLPSSRFFLNGYQSWTDSREFSPKECIQPFPPLLRPLLERIFRTNHYGDYHFVPAVDQHLHGFTYYYRRDERRQEIHFCGSLSEREGFTIFRVLPEVRRIIIQKDCEGLSLAPGEAWTAFELFVQSGDAQDVMANYLAQCHEAQGLSNRSTPPWTGWTSWYYHYTNITEAIITSNLDAFVQKKVPIDVFQIDDGWQAAVGDWLDINSKFAQGLRPIVDRIHAAGIRAGLWLAPLVAEKKSRLFVEHPEWVLRDIDGNPIPAGNSALWSGDFYGLDIDNEDLRNYLAQVFDTILNVWGFDLVKLDFLYGACLVPAHGKTRGTRMVESLDFLRRLVGDKYILGCGVPLGPAIGRVDICRIGPDVGHEWANTLTRGLGMRETISTVTALENAIGRCHLSGQTFSNDPDVFFLRELSFAHQKFDPFLAFQELRHGKQIPLSSAEKYTLFLLNNIFGRLVFTSDDIQEYSVDMWDLYTSSFPLLDKRDVRVKLVGPVPAFGEVGGCYEIRFCLGDLQYWAYANLANEAVNITLPVAGFSRDEKLRGRFHASNETLTLKPHSAFCMLQEGPGEFALLGSESHLFPGSDIITWTRIGSHELTFVRDERARGHGRIFFRIPADIPGIIVNGQFIQATTVLDQKHLIVVPVELAKGKQS
jgi:alpha-galactosidase